MLLCKRFFQIVKSFKIYQYNLKKIFYSVFLLLCVYIIVIGGFYESIRNGHVQIVSFFLKIGIGPEIKFINTAPSLHQAGSAEVASLLLKYGADINAINEKDGFTPLHAASVNGHREVISLLIKHGVDVNEKDKWGWTPLFNAVSRGDPDNVNLLLSNGADVNALDQWNETPLHISIRRRYFLFLSNRRTHLKIMQLLIQNGADVNKRNHNGDTPLHMAGFVIRERIPTMLSILEYNPDVNIKNNAGQTPLHGLVDSRNNLNAIVLLLKHGANVNIKDNQGKTPLHIVSSSFFPRDDIEEVIPLLIQYGADINTVDSEGKTPLHTIRAKNKYRKEQIDTILLKYGAK